MFRRYINVALLLICSALSAQEPKDILDPEITRFMQEKGIPGIAAALYYEGHSYLLNYGVKDARTHEPVNENTIFEIASITKVFTSTALALEVQKGRISLNAPALNYLPALRNRNIPFRQVTLMQLATHTSSLPRVPPAMRRGTYTPHLVIQYLEHWKPSEKVGTKYLYSNLGFGIIGYTIAAVNGKHYEEVIRDTILRPLNMSSTEILVPRNMLPNYAQGYTPAGKNAQNYPLNAWPGGGALRSTSRDMLNFLMANLGVRGPENLIKAMQLTQQGFVKVNDHLTMGLGWQRLMQQGNLLVDKNGGVDGFSSYIGMLPDKKIGIVLLADKGKTQITDLGRHLLHLLAQSAPNAIQ